MTLKIPILVFFVIPMLFLQSCKSDQDELFEKFKSEFQNSIKKSDAIKFEYQFDGLCPQTSYFVGCKIKYLKLESSGELTTIKEFIIFKNDSMSKLVKRVEVYRGNNNGNEAGRNWSEIETDTIYVIDFIKNKEDFYANSKLVKTRYFKKINGEYLFIYKVKESTENNYNCR